jgi:hypothetical protein
LKFQFRGARLRAVTNAHVAIAKSKRTIQVTQISSIVMVFGFSEFKNALGLLASDRSRKNFL